MKKLFFLGLLFSLYFNSIYGQQRFYNSYFYEHPPGTFVADGIFPESPNFQTLKDGSFLIAGFRNYNAFFSTNYFEIIKTDELGQVLWSKRMTAGLEFDSEDNDRLMIVDIIEEDDGYVIALNRKRHNDFESNSYLLKISLDGEYLIWQRKMTELSDPFNPGHFQFSQIVKAKDVYAFVGTLGLVEEEAINESHNQLIVGEINPNSGTILWNRKIDQSEEVGLQGLSIYFHERQDAYYVGARSSDFSEEVIWGEVVIIKIDKIGNLLWSRHYNDIYSLPLNLGFLPIVDHHPAIQNQNLLAFIGQTNLQDFTVVPFNSNNGAPLQNETVKFPIPEAHQGYVKSAALLENGNIACLMEYDNHSTTIIGRLTNGFYPGKLYDLNSPDGVWNNEHTFFKKITNQDNQVFMGGAVLSLFDSENLELQYGLVKSDEDSQFPNCISKENLLGIVSPIEALNFGLTISTDPIFSTKFAFSAPETWVYTKKTICEECTGIESSFDAQDCDQDCVCIFNNTSSPGINATIVEYQWQVNNINSQLSYTYTTEDLVFAPTCNGLYEVCLQIKDSNGCIARTCGKVFSVDCTECECQPGVDQCEENQPLVDFPTGSSLEANYVVYPNPAKNRLQLKFNAPIETTQLSLRDITGRIIHFEELETGITQHNIDITKHLPGVYYLFMETSGITLPVQKIVISGK